jgi:hypothetical protein
MEAGSRETLKSAWMTVRYEGWFWPTFRLESAFSIVFFLFTEVCSCGKAIGS